MLFRSNRTNSGRMTVLDEMCPSVRPLPDLLVEECLTVRVNGDQVGAAPSGNVDPGQRQQRLKDAVSGLDALKPALKALAERRAQLAEDDQRRVREASLRRNESLRMRFNCEPAPAGPRPRF